jgi:hypothetical protein
MLRRRPGRWLLAGRWPLGALVLASCASAARDVDAPRRAAPAATTSEPVPATPSRTASAAAVLPSEDEALARLAALEAEFKAAENEFWSSIPKGDDGTLLPTAEDWARVPSKTFLPRFQSLAESARGTAAEADALMALLKVATSSYWPEKDTSVEADAAQALLERHAASPRLVEFAARLRYLDHVLDGDRVDAGLARLAESPHADVRARALQSQAERLLERDGTDDAARAVLQRLLREHPGSGPAQEAEGLLFQLDHLRVGQVAPDREAVDADGGSFRLSDYRGRVVLLVFWGFW